ncbi:MAG: AAA family ATPase, partial [Desulfobacterales bacterium]
MNYLDFYGLKQKPFQLTTDPKFLWLGQKHGNALDLLSYGVRDNKGFLMLLGEVGTGKTTLINALVRRQERDVVYGIIQDPLMSRMDLLNTIAAAFCLEPTYESKLDFLDDFRLFLHQTRKDGRRVLLVIDEAQRLTNELLDEVRMLNSIDASEQVLINIFFVGHSDFANTVLEPANRALRQRISINHVIATLDPEETKQLVRHRLKVAGASRTIFEDNAFSEIHRFSGGAPRLINVVCDHALLTGFSRGEKRITDEMIRDSLDVLVLPNELNGKLTDASWDPAPSSCGRRETVPPPPPPPTRRPSPLTAWASGALVTLLLAATLFVYDTDRWMPRFFPDPLPESTDVDDTRPTTLPGSTPSGADADTADPESGVPLPEEADGVTPSAAGNDSFMATALTPADRPLESAPLRSDSEPSPSIDEQATPTTPPEPTDGPTVGAGSTPVIADRTDAGMPSEGPIALEALSTETPVEATSTQPPSTGHKADASLDSQPGAARTPAADSPASVLAAADTLPPKTSPKRIARASLKPKDKGADRIDMTGASLASIANEAQPTPEADLAARTKQRLEAFLSAYASAYESRNVD